MSSRTDPAGLRTGYLADHPDAESAVADWLHSEWHARRGWTPWQSRAVLLARLNRRHLPLALVALADDRPVGTASLVEDEGPDQSGPLAFLASVYVESGQRGRGVGTMLCRRALAEARRLRLPGLWVYTPDRAGFYERLGWRVLRDVVVPVGAGFELVTCLECALNPMR